MQYLTLISMMGSLNTSTSGIHDQMLIYSLSLFFFVYFRVYCDAGGDDRHEKDVVRGYTFAEYHADVYDKTESEVTGAGLDCECLGGGRIEHRPGDKYIKVPQRLLTQFSV